MVASLKGNAKIVIPENAKPGEEIEVQGITFDADQADFERALRGRLDQAKRQAEAEKAELTKTIEELKGNAPKPDEQLKLQVERLSNELSSAKLERRIEAQLKAANLADLPDAYRATIRVKPDASDEDLAAAVEAAGKSFLDLKTSLGGNAEGEPKKKPTIGNPGNGGSGDPKNKLETLRDKVKKNRPDLIKHLDGISPEQQQEVMDSWEAQGVLSPKK